MESALALLKGIMSDFAKLETDTRTAEMQSADAFVKQAALSEADKDVYNKQIEHSTTYKETKERALCTAREDLKLTQDSLGELEDAHYKLQAKCVYTGSTHEERDGMRKEEIQ